MLSDFIMIGSIQVLLQDFMGQKKVRKYLDFYFNVNVFMYRYVFEIISVFKLCKLRCILKILLCIKDFYNCDNEIYIFFS